MSLVNSFVNQIGRELGRDAYRSVVSSTVRKRSKRIIQEEEPLLEQVRNFELLTSDEMTLRELINLVEKSENTDAEDFEWNELFYELDNKIDFCKANLPVEFQDQLDKLDEINANNYQNIKAKHVAFIDSLILHVENLAIDLSKKSTFIAAILTVVGLRPSYMREKFIYTLSNLLYLFLLVLIFYNGFLTFRYPDLFNGNLPKETPSDLELIATMGKVLMIIPVGFYVLYFVLGMRKILKLKDQVQKNMDIKIQLESYKSELLK